MHAPCSTFWKSRYHCPKCNSCHDLTAHTPYRQRQNWEAGSNACLPSLCSTTSTNGPLCTPDSSGCPRKVPHILTGQRVTKPFHLALSTASCSALPPLPEHVASCSVIYLLSHFSVFKQVISGLIRTGMHPWRQSSVGA